MDLLSKRTIWSRLLFVSVSILFNISCSVQGSSDGPEYFIAVNGTDRPNCDLGSRQKPWRSLANQYKKGCINPGDRIYFMKGDYYANSDVFLNHIDIHGSINSPITISRDPISGESWPVRFIGRFVISNAESIIIDGIEFVREKDDDDILAIGASHITIKNSKIHGLQGDYNKSRLTKGDCIKIAGGMKVVENIRILSNEIYNCSEDAIGISGRKNIEIQGNNIHHAWVIQVKGGAENVIIKNNEISNLRFGISGDSMDCSTQNIYCGSPVLPTLPVYQRFQAKNISIVDNKITDITGRAIDFSGWRNVKIFNNTIRNGNLNGGAVIRARSPIGIVFTDEYAKKHCEIDPESCQLDSLYCRYNSKICTGCKLANGKTCWKIKLKAKNVNIFGNIIESDNPLIIDIEKDTVTAPQTVCEKNNRITSKNEDPKFRLYNVTYKKMKEYPICHAL